MAAPAALCLTFSRPCLREHLAVVDVGWGNGEPADETMLGINADAVLVSVVSDAVLYHPTSVKILLAQPLWLVAPPFWQRASFDALVLLP
jgi:hypothetical protein